MKATPALEYGRMNIGSRPSKRKPSGGSESLRAIPWIFAWTQTRFHLPVWLGFGEAFKFVIKKDPIKLKLLQEMYNEWPFSRVTIDDRNQQTCQFRHDDRPRYEDRYQSDQNQRDDYRKDDRYNDYRRDNDHQDDYIRDSRHKYERDYSPRYDKNDR